ncbi:MAG: polysaccharide biosynthesis/export family protein [Tannerella sp.]|jgi:polysaccharide export outer membrane protein|nr:polysaccharide biosynthesis/export family protein [Tannerella sp.]
MKSKAGLMLCIILLSGSCRVPRDVTYFQGIDNLSQQQWEAMKQTYNTKICADDMLTISVSSWDPSVVAPFNPPAYGYYPQGEKDMNQSVQNLYSYLVNREGNVNFPVLGQVHLAGLTVHEANRKLQDLIVKYAPDVLVNVQIVNFKVGIFGEVTRTNMYTIPNSRISVLDLIAMAGDLTINANRKNILLIRDNEGKKEHVRLDITDPNIMASPYFYMQQNDMVYVEPNKAKIRNANYSSAQQYTLTIVSTIMTGVNVISTIILAITSQARNK